MQYGILRTTRESVIFANDLRTPALTAFGLEAETIARRYPTDLSLLICDTTGLAEARIEAARRRREDKPFLVMPLLNEYRCILSRTAAMNIYQQFKDQRQRHDFFSSLASGTMHFNGKPIFSNEIYTPESIAGLQEVVALGGGLHVRSQTERTRVESVLQSKHMYVGVAPLVDYSVPDIFPHRDASYVVVWAPHENALNLAAFSFALWNLDRPAIFVCRGEIPDSPHRFVTLERAEDALVHAAVIVDTQISDPGTALAFAGRGYGIATAGTSGAHEYMQGTAIYDMYDFQSIADAVARASRDRRAFALPYFDAVATLQTTISATNPEPAQR